MRRRRDEITTSVARQYAPLPRSQFAVLRVSGYGKLGRPAVPSFGDDEVIRQFAASSSRSASPPPKQTLNRATADHPISPSARSRQPVIA